MPLVYLRLLLHSSSLCESVEKYMKRQIVKSALIEGISRLAELHKNKRVEGSELKAQNLEQ